MRLIRSRLLIAALAVLFASVIARSQTADAAPAPPTHGHEWAMGGGHRGHHMEFFARYLELTDAQRTQMKAVLQKEHGTMKPLMQQMHQTETQLKQYEQGAYDEAKVRALAAQQAQTQIELTVQKTRIHSELFQLLTPEQQTKMKEFEANREARWQKHMESKAPAGSEQ
jgi:Spy/CpxP family protein refolding chaperone